MAERERLLADARKVRALLEAALDAVADAEQADPKADAQADASAAPAEAAPAEIIRPSRVTAIAAINSSCIAKMSARSRS